MSLKACSFCLHAGDGTQVVCCWSHALALSYPYPPKGQPFDRSESFLRNTGPERINCKDEPEPGRTERTQEEMEASSRFLPPCGGFT